MAVTVNAAVYGVAVYGTARYGKIIVSGLDQVEATGSISTVQVNTAAGLTGVTAIGAIQTVAPGGFEIDIVERVDTGVEASGAVNTVQINIAEVLASVSATITVNGDGLNIKSVNRVPVIGVVGTGAITSAQVDITEKVSSVGSTCQANTVQINTSAGLSGVEATGYVNDTLVFKTTHNISSVSATFSVGTIDVVSTELLDSVLATGQVNTLTVHVTEKLDKATSTASIGSVSVTAVVFNFEAVRNLYSRKRTIYIPRAA